MIRMDERLNNLLQEQAQKYGVSLSEKQRQQFDRYMDLLLHWNEKMNLTAILPTVCHCFLWFRCRRGCG